MEFVNCTPHALTVHGLGTIPPSGIVPRCATVRTEAHATVRFAGAISGVRLIKQTLGEVQGLPEPKADTIYVVSAMVLSALAGARADVVAPDTGADAIRENGQIVAVRGFVV